ELGQDKLAASLQSECDEHERFWGAIQDGPPGVDFSEMVHAGIVWGYIFPALPGYRVDFAPLRTAESWVAAEVGLLALLAVLTLTALILGAAGLVSWAMSRKGRRPMLLFLGWREMGKICLLSIALPLAAYGAYTYIQGLPKDAYGLNYTAGRVILEFVAVISLVCTLLIALSYSAIRRRCKELGIDVPEQITLRRRWLAAGLAALLVLATLAYVIGWWAGPFRPRSIGRFGGLWDSIFGYTQSSGVKFPSVEGLLFAGAVVLLTTIWILVELARLGTSRKMDLFRGTFFRSMMPILSSAVILVALACGLALRQAESSAAGRVTGAAALSFSELIDRSDYRLLRERFKEWYVQDQRSTER
ncbi:MAG: hypothetical protein HQ546_08700, partial [Planctomycetes bacterium]|nr:hypothetical protein [Planctomycetota bacterium]